MKIYKYLEKNLIFLDKDFKSKEEISSEIIDMIYKIDSRTDKELLLKDIIDREKNCFNFFWQRYWNFPRKKFWCKESVFSFL